MSGAYQSPQQAQYMGTTSTTTTHIPAPQSSIQQQQYHQQRHYAQQHIAFTTDSRGCCSWCLNIIWLLIGGWHLWLTWFTIGACLCLTVVGFPCGWQAIKISWFLLFPFGKQLKYTSDSIGDEGAKCCTESCNCCCNIFWAFSVGWILALQAILTGILLILTIVGIPFSWGCFQLAYLSFRPFGVDFTAEETIVVATNHQQPNGVAYYQQYP